MIQKNHFSEFIRILSREGELIQSTDLFISTLQNFLNQEFHRISPIDFEFQSLILVSNSISPVLDLSRGQLALGKPPENPVRYLNFKKNKYYLMTCPHQLLSSQKLNSKDKNIPIYKINIKADKAISEKKISAKLINNLRFQLKLLAVSYGIGVLEGLQKATVQHATNRKSNGIALMHHNNISYQLANNLIQISKLKAVFSNCFDLMMAGSMNSVNENILMYLNDQTHQIVIDSAMQIFGAQSMKADTLPAIAIRRSLALRGLTENKTNIIQKMKLDILKKKQSQRRLKGVYSIEGL